MKLAENNRPLCDNFDNFIKKVACLGLLDSEELLLRLRIKNFRRGRLLVFCPRNFFQVTNKIHKLLNELFERSHRLYLLPPRR